MPRHEASCTIDAPPDVVWRLLSDVARWPEWLPTVTRVDPLAGRDLALGAQYRIEQPRLRPAVWRVTRLEPSARFTWASGGPGLQVLGDHELAPAPNGGTTVTLRISFAGPLAALIWPLSRSLTAQYVDQEAAALKRTAEQQAAGAAG